MREITFIHIDMRVLGSDGNYVGTVERLEGEHIRLTRGHPKAGGQNHWVPLDWVVFVNGDVFLDRESDQARRSWFPSAQFAIA